MKKITLFVSCITFSGVAQSANASPLQAKWIKALSCDSIETGNGYIDSQEWMMQQFESRDKECIPSPEGVFFHRYGPLRLIKKSLVFRFDSLRPALLILFLKHKLITINDVVWINDEYFSLLKRALLTEQSSFSSGYCDYLERIEVLLAFGADPSGNWDKLDSLLEYVEQVDLCYSNQQAGNCSNGLGLSIDIPNMRHLLKLYRKRPCPCWAMSFSMTEGLAFRPFYQEDEGDLVLRRKNKERYERRKALIIEEIETPLHIAARFDNKWMARHLLFCRKRQMIREMEKQSKE